MDVFDFGLRLKELREKKGYTQEQVGKYAEVSGGSISGYENNIAVPPADVLKRLAILYGVTTDYLYGLDKRRAIVIDVKSPEQEQALEQVINLIQEQFNKI